MTGSTRFRSEPTAGYGYRIPASGIIVLGFSEKHLSERLFQRKQMRETEFRYHSHLHPSNRTLGRR
jgi:hypothetical protein